MPDEISRRVVEVEDVGRKQAVVLTTGARQTAILLNPNYFPPSHVTLTLPSSQDLKLTKLTKRSVCKLLS